MERNVYLKVTDLEEAVDSFLKDISEFSETIKSEYVNTMEASSRVTSEASIAITSSPNHNAAAMDGIMVIAERTYMANEANPVILKKDEDFQYVNTGQIIKEPYDSVIMIEDVVPIGNLETPNQVKIITQAAPWQHIRPIGEDIVSGEMIIPKNHVIRPEDIGALLSGGVSRVRVYERISVGVMPTGSEITDNYDSLIEGKIFDTNSWTFKAILEDAGCIVNRISPVRDEYSQLKEALLKLVEENHMVIINAGSSAGSHDYTLSLIKELGEVLLHGIAIKPGKPTILGTINGKPIVGVPGYPGSAFLVFEEVVMPLIRKLQRVDKKEADYINCVLSRRIISSLKNREYVRVSLGKVGDKIIATPLNRGAGITMSLVKSDGILVIPKNSEGFDAGAAVKISLTKDKATIDNTLVSIGSHDLLMDYIGSMILGFCISSSHVGSMGGIMALARGEAHIAPIHLLDEETGLYNLPYIEKYLKDKAFLIKGVKREQGLMIKKGNPKQINSLKDIAREGISFVNRQRGSGTRVLTDFLLKKDGIDISRIKGYDRDMTTHMAVAAAVKSGTADVGVGVYSAAKTMDLDFVSIGYEDYDFAVSKDYINTPMIKAFQDVLESQAFLELLKELGGYGK